MILKILTFLQIILESLPIGSSGHLFLATKFYNIFFGESVILSKTYEYLMYGPTLIVLGVFFREKIFLFLKGLKNNLGELKKILLLGICAEIPTLFLYFIFLKVPVEKFPVWLGFFFTGILLISTKFVKKNLKKVTFFQAFIIGIAQGMALLPGISRLGTTYTIARWFGIGGKEAFNFSWLIAAPIMGAGFLKGAFEFFKFNSFSENNFGELGLLIIIAMIIAYILLRFVEKLIVDEKIWWLGFYMIIPMLLALL